MESWLTFVRSWFLFEEWLSADVCINVILLSEWDKQYRTGWRARDEDIVYNCSCQKTVERCRSVKVVEREGAIYQLRTAGDVDVGQPPNSVCTFTTCSGVSHFIRVLSYQRNRRWETAHGHVEFLVFVVYVCCQRTIMVCCMLHFYIPSRFRRLALRSP